MLTLVIMILIPVMFGLMIYKIIQDMIGKKKKPKMVEIPRDSMERLDKAYKTGVRGKLNKHKVRHTIIMSGDELVPGYKLGDLVAIQPQNEEYICYIKRRWWFFWRKATPIHIDPELCTDFNARQIVIEGRGFEAETEGEYYLIPRYGTQNLEVIYAQRARNKNVRFLKQTLRDLNIDSDFIIKASLRGDVAAAMAEIGRYEEMPQILEEKVRKRQEKLYDTQSEGGS